METGEEKWSGHTVFSRLPSTEAAAAADLPPGGGEGCRGRMGAGGGGGETH